MKKESIKKESKTAPDPGKQERDKQKALELISSYTKHNNVKLVQRGNAAIFCALAIVKKINPKPFILIPDQGGWMSFLTYPKLLGFDIKKVRTDRGLIDLIDLESKAETGAAMLVTSFAGYFAEQPINYISKICKRSGCILIEDASGALADDQLSDGYYSDIIVGSFGRWKPINLEYGGFISVAKKEYFTECRDIFSTVNFYPKYDVLINKLNTAEQGLKNMLKKAEAVKKEISERYPELKIIHKDIRGINVVVRHMNEKEKEQIEKYCDEKGYDYIECPQYTRLDEDAISIELKRLNGNGN